MPIEGFDYKEFANMMSSQAGELVPKNFNDMQRNYVVKTLTNFTLLAGEAISNDAKLNFNADQAVFVTQIIAEWSFHKSIDLVHSGIMPEHWDGVMQKIAFTIFEIAKQAIQKNIPQDKTLQLIEHHVDKTYREAIADLEKRGIISNEISKKAASQSNIDDMAKQVQEQEEQERARQAAQAQAQAQDKAKQQSQGTPLSQQQMSSGNSDGRELKLKSIAMVMKLLDETRAKEVLAEFPPEIAQKIMSYVNTPRLEEQVDLRIALQCLEDLKIIIPKKRKLSQDNVVREMNKVFDVHQMEDIEQLIKPERPFIKRFVSQAYEGDYYSAVPLKVAEILVGYIKDSCKNEQK
ncbi:MAG: hypothetical protein LUB59_05125 [Candidatus Gastranaerophilales bacterium]|nr:hypothetical protein [Candidatus Gastranaerophilales bacterium]